MGCRALLGVCLGGARKMGADGILMRSGQGCYHLRRTRLPVTLDCRDVFVKPQCVEILQTIKDDPHETQTKKITALVQDGQSGPVTVKTAPNQ